ncbi:hypothetical protein QR680_005284 [Steinernema hermaphroditum]|uniref:Uncharacterized protein n=1 Tax=Steinernema hermaphroditum TaxID=289476 RepID=A0AA39LV29_9BILA|nr:hypothetical protein QR680_005284 [Steinernema hermaphroditum]
MNRPSYLSQHMRRIAQGPILYVNFVRRTRAPRRVKLAKQKPPSVTCEFLRINHLRRWIISQDGLRNGLTKSAPVAKAVCSVEPRKLDGREVARPPHGS